MKNTESGATPAGGLAASTAGQLSRARGPPTRHSARLSLVPGDIQTRRTTSGSGLISGIAVKTAGRGAPLPEPEPSRQTTVEVRSPHVASPHHERLCRAGRSKLSPAPSYNVVPHREGSAVLKKSHRDPLRAKSSLTAAAASAAHQRCPAPHWRLLSNTRRRETLQADETTTK
jgi:hypothetical protein